MGFGLRGARRFARHAVLVGALLCGTIGFAASGAFAAGDEHGADGHAHDGKGHGHKVNWFEGFLGESEDIEHPNWMWRHPGMPVPMGAYFINTSVLFYIIYRMGRKPLADGLRQRRERIMRGMDEAGKMKAEAAAQLSEYQAKLDKIDSEVARVRQEMQASAEAEREQILAEAKKRRERMEREAQQLIVQELKAAREQLMKETVKSAIDSARQLLTQQVNSSDHQRLSDEYVETLKSALVNSSGGQA